MARKLALRTGGEVLLVASDDQRITFESESAAPPGSSLDLIVCGAPVAVKVRACRRTAPADAGRFLIEGRFINLSREQREALLVE